MRGTWATMSVLLWACASGGGPQSKLVVLNHEVAAQQAATALLARHAVDKAAFKVEQGVSAAKSSADRKTKTSAGEQVCTRLDRKSVV